MADPNAIWSHWACYPVPMAGKTRRSGHLAGKKGVVVNGETSRQVRYISPKLKVCQFLSHPFPSNGGSRGSWTKRTRCELGAGPPSPISTPSRDPPSSTCSGTPPRIRRGGRCGRFETFLSQLPTVTWWIRCRLGHPTATIQTGSSCTSTWVPLTRTQRRSQALAGLRARMPPVEPAKSSGLVTFSSQRYDPI